MNTATFRREHQNRLSADTMLDLVVSRHAADTTEYSRRQQLCPAGEKELKIVMASLDDAGKTTTLYRLRVDTAVTTIPTTSFNVERVRHRSLELTVWDIGGQEGLG